jgi:unspecific monooxygenase
MLPPSLFIDAAAAHVRLDPRDDAFVQDPYRAYAAIRAACPVFFWEEYGHWCCAGHGDVGAILKDRRFGRQPPMPRAADQQAHLAAWRAAERHSLLELEPPDHTRLRALVNRAFVSRQVESLRPRITALAHRLIDGFEGQGEADLLESFATPIPVAIIAALIGVPETRCPDLLDWSHRMVAMYQFGRDRAVEDAAEAAARDFSGFLRELIAERRARPADDLLSRMIAAESDGARLSPDEMVSTAILLLNAGHEATVHAIGNGVNAMLGAGLDGRSATADAALPGLVEEILRHDAPLHMFTRHAAEEVAVGPARLKAGEVIGLLLGAANRDPARFDEPDRFQPGRAASAHLSFGAGIHFCLGAPLARLELEAALPVLFARLPRLRLAARPRYRDSYHFHGLESLPVAW